MKRSILTIAIALIVTFSSFANDDQKYYEIMGKTIKEMFSATDAAEVQASLNMFERISNAEADKWEPAYYTAFAYLKLYELAESAADKDAIIDKAIASVNEGLKIAENEDELITMKGYVYMMKMVLDPMNRAPEYSPIIIGSYQKALTIDPNNPRAWYLLGQMQLGTASFTGGSTDQGCASISKAVENFKNDKSENPIAPSWGESGAEEATQQCR
ncbi:MAG: tetratricopeptide repeat protein [Bacteroidota bacterium]